MNLPRRRSGVGAAFKALLKAGRKPLLASTSVLTAAALVARDLADMSIEELLDESVTSVSKREQKRGDVAAAIAVLSNDDLHRSGVMTIADALRLVPGMNVGSVNANQWAVSARGHNSLYATKLLVLIDGRAVYSPLFAGVYWDLQQPMLEDVDRIEVIRGPGATVWGANAVNGVINVVSQSARDTQGTVVFGGGGEIVESFAGVRHGAQWGENTYFRIYAEKRQIGDSPLSNGQPAGDQWELYSGGFRLDHYPDSETQFTWQGDVVSTDLDANTSHGRNVNTLARWTRQLGERSSLQVQTYYDVIKRNDLLRSFSTIDTFDFTIEHTTGIGERHDLIWGVGYRGIDAEVRQTDPTIVVTNPEFDLKLFSAFVQDEFRVVPDRLTLTAGVKLEHNDSTGVEVQPSVRGVWKPAQAHTVWAAVSRAVRTPSALEDENVFTMPLGAPEVGPDGGMYLPVITGNGNPDAEEVFSYEAGWRIQANERVSVDLATFYNSYETLITVAEPRRVIPGVPLGRIEFPFLSGPGLDTYGAELTVTVAPTKTWRVTGSYSWLRGHEPGLPQVDPENQALLRSSHDLGRCELDLQLRYVGSFAYPMSTTVGSVPSYVEADVRFAVHVSDTVELSIVGQNLLDGQHVEQGPTFYSVTAEAPRRVFGKLTLRF